MSRSHDGAPGDRYWQNRADYQIKVNLDPQERRITGSEVIRYSNESPDTLKQLVFHLYQDLYKIGTARDWDLGPMDMHKGVSLKSIKINGNSIDLKSRNIARNASLLFVKLKNYIAPKSNATVEISWSFVLPAIRNVRMGTYHKTSFMVAYWFPKIAVYDDINAWNTIPYTGNCEFYPEFGNYDVEISLPKDYLVWATGTLQNEKDLFTKKYFNRIQKAKTSDDIVTIVSATERKEGKILKAEDIATWHFKSVNRPDFAFAASNTYQWDATSVISGNRRVSINAAYWPESKNFKDVAPTAKKVIDYFTNTSPGIAYPYPQFTAFNGHGGMEFPGMVNDGDAKTNNGTLYLTAHELGHSYFPFANGLNEQLYAWMDEGMISYIPRKFLKANTLDTNYVFFKDIIQVYNKQAASSLEIPLILPSTNTGKAYRYQAYNKSSTAYYCLNEYIGDEKFNNALQLFYKNWAGKHPIPYDFFNCFNKAAGEDLGWFWKAWFFDMNYPDLSIEKDQNKGFKIVNNTHFPIAVHATISFADGQTKKIYLPANYWNKGVYEITLHFKGKTIQSVVLDYTTTPDAFPENNIWPRK